MDIVDDDKPVFVSVGVTCDVGFVDAYRGVVVQRPLAAFWSFCSTLWRGGCRVAEGG